MANSFSSHQEFSHGLWPGQGKKQKKERKRGTMFFAPPPLDPKKPRKNEGSEAKMRGLLLKISLDVNQTTARDRIRIQKGPKQSKRAGNSKNHFPTHFQ